MSKVAVSTPFNIHLDFEVAAFHKRLLAWALDICIMVIFAWGMRLIVAEFTLGKSYPLGIDILFVSVPLLFYHLVSEVVFQGQSLGKRAMGIRVLSLEGGEPNIGQYLLRWIFRVWEWPLVFGVFAFNQWALIFQLMVCMFLGVMVVIVIAVTPRSQRLGDLAAGTSVVDIRKQFSLDDTIFQEIGTPGYRVAFPEVMRLSDRDINAIKSVLNQTRKTGRYDTAHRISARVKEVLDIRSDLEVTTFLEKLLSDYNYLATKE